MAFRSVAPGDEIQADDNNQFVKEFTGQAHNWTQLSSTGGTEQVLKNAASYGLIRAYEAGVPVFSLLGFPQYPVDLTGASDVSGAFSQILTLVGATLKGGVVEVPEGIYRFDGPIQLTSAHHNVTIRGVATGKANLGGGWGPVFKKNFASGDLISVGDNVGPSHPWGVRIENIAFKATVAQTSGAMINGKAASGILGAEGLTISNCHFMDYFEAVRAAPIGWLSIRDCTFYQGTTYVPTFGSASIQLDGIGPGTADIIGCQFSADQSTAYHPTYGVACHSATAIGSLMISDCDFIGQGYDLSLQNAFSVYSDNCNFDTAQYGAVLAPGNGQYVGRIMFSNCWFGSHTASGAIIQPSHAAGEVHSVQFTGCLFFGSTSHGLLINRGTATTWGQITVNGGQFTGQGTGVAGIATSNLGSALDLNLNIVGVSSGISGSVGGGISSQVAGISIGNNSKRWSVIGSHLVGNLGTGANGIGLLIGTTCDEYVVVGNVLAGNSGSQLTNNSGGAANAVVANNLIVGASTSANLPLPVAQGGTGATTAAGARANLITAGTITTTEIADGTIAAGDLAAGSTWQLISEVAGTGASTTITFSGIAASWRHLALVWNCRSDAAGGPHAVVLRFNNDIGAKYDSQDGYDSNAARTITPQAAITFGQFGFATGAGATANFYGEGMAIIPHYKDTTRQKSYEAVYGVRQTSVVANLRSGKASGWYQDTAAISRIDLILAAGNFTTDTKFALYGIP